MKLLPKKSDIDKAKANERKQEIDSGIALAKKVDALREAKLQEEKSLREWREGSIRKVQEEIDSYIETMRSLKKQVDAAFEQRNKLLEPLNKEWEELNLEKLSLKEKEAHILESERKLDDKRTLIEEERKKLSKVVSKSKENENETEKYKLNALNLNQMAEKEYDNARQERITQSEAHKTKIAELEQTKKEYENGISINQSEEKILKEKEEDLIIREKHLATQQVQLRIAMEAIKKHAS